MLETNGEALVRTRISRHEGPPLFYNCAGKATDWRRDDGLIPFRTAQPQLLIELRAVIAAMPAPLRRHIRLPASVVIFAEPGHVTVRGDSERPSRDRVFALYRLYGQGAPYNPFAV